MGDLSEFESVNPVIVTVRFDDHEGNVFFGGLEMDEREFNRVRSYPNCPKDKQSLEYYEYLRDKADAVPCSPDHINPPLVKRTAGGTVLAAYQYGVNAQSALDLRPATDDELRAAHRASTTYFMTGFLWAMHVESLRKLLPAPKAA